ncbi:MAG: tripartite tricarboxylate transporter substrate binding protein [Proteobacteria bacterium]|nr:tripartite tricarboxylate transporter substrate binding protein [Pseudomonadota bacterium]
MRRAGFAAALLAAFALCAPGAAAAADFPSRPIRIVVPYAPGGASETMARLVADRLTAALKQPVIIENRPGGGTVIGASVVAQAPDDGYTLFVNASSYVINSHLISKLPYDPWKDFAPIALAASNPHVLVTSNALGTRSLAEFLALAKSRGKALSYASFGNGSSGHLAFELLKKTYGFDMEHVPYKSTPQAMMDVIGGQIQAMLTDTPAAVPQAKAGKMMVLAIAADQRSPSLPEVPTFQEATGTRFVSRSWFGFLVRSGTPPEVQKLLQTEIVRALKSPEVKDKLHDLGMETIGSTPEEFSAFMKAESERFADAIRFSGTNAD